MESLALDTTFGTVTVFDNIISIVVDEGATFKADDLAELFELYDTHFPNKNFGYISNRINDYSIELSPKLYRSVHSNLVAIAAVCYTDASYRNAQFEKEFYKKPFAVFRKYDDAVAWLEEFI
ncbi:hypothetical protein QRD02_04440 [Aequorivita sp. SDUM287046]|uniref:STAS/SEC14 domain-containing protein n=1 Tax=Aequorivita aurantiaca TaxID=3053356 RepID=A0ABT8DHZ6_9FLAO|nr:hypothetical protein [Aequorivita aurantiaca]MDN3723619.1 hypothetical protein [Aequorivita aurantiaca]